MHKNQIWLAFLATTALIVLWFTATTIYDLYNYANINSTTEPADIIWSVKGRSSDRYLITASYRYEVGGIPYNGETIFAAPTYRNPRAASKAIEMEKLKSWKVWYSGKLPEKSTLQKTFPLKSCVYTAILWGLFLYFNWLGFYVGKFNFNKDPGEIS